MSKPGRSRVLAVGAFVLLAAGSAFAESTSPPKNLHKVGDHWTPWSPPAPGAQDYIIQKDDTLWDLSQRWFQDPFLWPQIWDANRYILDSHWIYPGDPLVVPGRPTVVPDTEAPPIGEDTGAGAGDGEGDSGVADAQAGAATGADQGATGAAAPAPLVPAADPTDLNCSGYIAPEGLATDFSIAGNETERIALGQGDVVFMNRGRNAGVRAGDAYGIVRAGESVFHPATGEDLGTYIHRLGQIRVLIAHENSATALIETSCQDVWVGDGLVPWKELAVPLLSTAPEFDRLDPELGGGPVGHVVWQQDQLGAFGAGHVIHTDLGRASGVEPGDFIRLFRERSGDLPRMPIAHAVVLTVEPETSAAKITYSVREGTVGDQVELLVD